MVSCSAAIGCTNRSTDNIKIRFYQVPSEKKNKSLRKQWLVNIRRDGQLPKDNSFYICSDHFEENCFKRDLQLRVVHILHCKSRKILIIAIQSPNKTFLALDKLCFSS